MSLIKEESTAFLQKQPMSNEIPIYAAKTTNIKTNDTTQDNHRLPVKKPCFSFITIGEKLQSSSNVFFCNEFIIYPLLFSKSPFKSFLTDSTVPTN